MSQPYSFRAIWPVLDESLTLAEMSEHAAPDLPLLIAQARAKLLSEGSFTIADATRVPGSGRVTRYVLIYEAPAVRLPRRNPRPPTRERGSSVWRDDDDIDEITVQAVLSGEWAMPTSTPERTEICRRWHAAGRPLPLLAEFTGWKVERYFKARKEVAA